MSGRWSRYVDFGKRLGVSFFPAQADILTRWRKSGRRKLLLVAGRRSGKGVMLSVVALHNALVEDYSGLLRPGEMRFILVTATRDQQARDFVRVCLELLDNAPDKSLRRQVEDTLCTQNDLVFRNRVTIRALPTSSRSVRGMAASLVVLDELAHCISETEGFQAGKNLWQALVPSTVQFGKRGYIAVTSTPGYAQGVVWDLARAAETGQDPEILYVNKASWEMAPKIAGTRASLEAEFLADPETAAQEYGAQFEKGGGAFLSMDAIDEAVIRNRKELPFMKGYYYVAVADPAFAAGGDSFAVTIFHSVWGTLPDGSPGQGFVQDRLQTWRGKASPLNSDMVLDEIRDLLREFGLRRIVSDQYCVVPISDGLRQRGIDLIPRPLTSELKADTYSSLKRALNLRLVELLDDHAQTAELCALTSRPSPSGKPKIEAAKGRDDRATVCATAVYTLQQADEEEGNYPIALASFGSGGGRYR